MIQSSSGQTSVLPGVSVVESREAGACWDIFLIGHYELILAIWLIHHTVEPLGNGMGFQNPCGSWVWVWVEILLPASFKTKTCFEGNTCGVMGKTNHGYGCG